LNPKTLGTIFILLILIAPIPITLGKKRSSYLYYSTYIFENRGDDAFNLTEEDATMALFQSNNWQTVRIVNATHDIDREYTDVDGNRLAIFELPSEIAPNSSIVFSVTYEVESTDRQKPKINPTEAGSLSDIPPELVEEFCVETETFTTGDETIQSLALSLAANQLTVFGLVTRILSWFSENISYGNFEVPIYPNETLSRGVGDCDDQAILLITLCRALNVPALLQIGLVFNEGIESERSSWDEHLLIEQRKVGWHGWALIYVPPWGWVPIDLTLFRSQDPISSIMEAPEYEGYIITGYNVSRQAYIGDSHRTREALIDSDLYITVSETMVKEAPSSPWINLLYIAVGISAGSAIVGVIIVLSRRIPRSRMRSRLSKRPRNPKVNGDIAYERVYGF